MSKGTKIGLVVGIIALMIFVVWMFSAPGETDASRKPYVSDNWSKKFQPYDKTPLGLYLFTSLANAHLDKGNEFREINNWVQFDTLLEKDEEKKTFLFVGNNFGLKNGEMDTILGHVKVGSDLFLSFNDLTENLYSILFEEYNAKFEYAETINVFAHNNKYHMINLFQNDTIATDWKAFGNITPIGSFESLSSFMEMNNFIKVKWGEGHIYLHSTPAMFYNYQLKRLHGFKYTEFALDQLAKDQNVYSLELGRLSDNYGNEDVDENDGTEGKVDDSYLKLIFENPTLLTAMLLGIFGIILFVIFRSKRTRPIVPFKASKKDMTLAFAETITSIYFSKRNPYGLLQVQRKNFYAAVHRHFFVDIQRRESDKTLDILAEKSNTSRTEIDRLIDALETKEAFSVDEQYIADIARRQQAFYRKVGIISGELGERTRERELTFKRSLVLPALLILGGLFVIVLGVSYLMSSIGVGILLWPVGIILVVLGSLRVKHPYLKITKDELIHISPLGKKRIFKKEDLLSTEIRTKGAILHFTDNKKLIINYWDLSRFDKSQFKRFIAKLHTREL